MYQDDKEYNIYFEKYEKAYINCWWMELNITSAL